MEEKNVLEYRNSVVLPVEQEVLKLVICDGFEDQICSKHIKKQEKRKIHLIKETGVIV